MDFKRYIRDIPDWPKEGIVFKDITPLLRNPESFSSAIEALAKEFEGQSIEAILGAEARGFIIGAALAYRLGCGFIPARKPGKLPWDTAQAEYELEYGTDSLEIHTDAVNPGQKILIVDDVLATGGTASAKAKLVEEQGGEVVGIAFLMELTFLNGRDKLQGYNVHSLMAY